MTRSRLEMLEEFLRANPNDAFIRYGLAMEYAGQGRPEEAVTALRELLEKKPDYTAAYQQAGVLLARLHRTAEARTMFQHGIEAAARAGDLHTKSELELALHELPAEPTGQD